MKVVVALAWAVGIALILPEPAMAVTNGSPQDLHHARARCRRLLKPELTNPRRIRDEKFMLMQQCMWQHLGNRRK